MSNVLLAPQPPKFKFKIAAKPAEALAEWLEAAQGAVAAANRSTGDLRALEKKRTQVETKIAALESRADEDDAAAQLPALQIQLAAINRKVEAAYNEDARNIFFVLLSELRPLLTRAMEPAIDAEMERIATPLFPYYQRREDALRVVNQSDWAKFLRGLFLNDWKHQATPEWAIKVVDAALRCELPCEYPVNPQS